MHLSEQEIQILRELQNERWLNSAQLASRLSIAPFSVRSSLQAMRRFQLVSRGMDVQTVGHFRITGAGKRELAQRQQLRMVP